MSRVCVDSAARAASTTAFHSRTSKPERGGAKCSPLLGERVVPQGVQPSLTAGQKVPGSIPGAGARGTAEMTILRATLSGEPMGTVGAHVLEALSAGYFNLIE